ncbi:MAG: tetratricopeptide repeat protein [Longimicrobiales bacterium]|nr:tetratricopeptide repeat protein [Longimicrobiales bacterium]
MRGAHRALPALLLLAAAVPLAAQDDARLQAAREAYFGGEYEQALAVLAPLTRAAPAPEARILQARVLAETGRHDEALAALALPGAAAGAAGGSAAAALARTRGEVLMALGRWDEAEAAFRASVAGRAPDQQVARLRLAELDFLRGRRAEAMAGFDAFIDLYNGSAALTGEELLAVARAVTWLGRASSSLYQDALRAYDEAADALPGDPRPRVGAGDLFLARYASPDAHEEYRQVLERNPAHPDALWGRARAQDFDGNPEALATAERVLETNPNHVGARVLIARIHLRAEDPERARAAAERALSVNPNALEALAVLAAAHHRAGDEAAFRAALRRADALDPAYPGVYATLAEVSADTRKYREAVDFAREAVRRDPQAWDALGTLATNQLRTGALEEGRANMGRAFQGDPFNPWFKNTLDLLDTWTHFRVVRTEHFEIALREREADLLEPYVTALAEEAYAALAARYGAEPPTPIRLELYPSSADFSVRTLGLVGLGALGVSFGSTLVMDSPSARQAGEFNWASTLWHELAHAFHLGMSDHNVPRWFSEGLAVREQRVARPHWGFRPTPAFLQAWHDGRMPPLSRMNEGFVRPAFPQQVLFSYVLASLAFDWIEETYGFQAIRRFLDGYRGGRSTEALAGEILGLDSATLDGTFERYLRARFAGEIRAVADLPTPAPGGLAVPGRARGGAGAGAPGGAADVEALRARVRAQPGSFPARLALGRALLAGGDAAGAEEHLREALRLFPAYPGEDGPLRLLARIHRERGESERAADALRRLGTLNENAFEVHREEAELRRALGEDAGERAALTRAVEVFPYDPDLHERLAELHAAAGDTGGAVRERRAVLALDPVDRARAHLRLAEALLADGERTEARSQLLRALEIAPTYDEALELLLQIRGEGS